MPTSSENSGESDWPYSAGDPEDEFVWRPSDPLADGISPPDNWMERKGPSLPLLHRTLERVQNRLEHLDGVRQELMQLFQEDGTTDHARLVYRWIAVNLLEETHPVVACIWFDCWKKMSGFRECIDQVYAIAEEVRESIEGSR